MKLYSIYDRVGKSYGLPMAMASDVLAMRAVKMALLPGGTSALCLCPSDFDLCYIGSFDQETGVILSSGTPDCICSCDTLKEEPNG